MNCSRILAVFFRYFYVLRKGGFQLADLFYWPLMDILIWGLTSLWIRSEQGVPNLPLILMTALIFWQIAWRGAVDISTSLLQEYWHRNLMNLFSTPLTLFEWTLGVILLCICKLLITISFGVGIVYVLYALKVFSIGWAFLPFAASLLLFGWVLGFFASGLIIYWGRKVEALPWMIAYCLAPFSAVFYPVAILPTWVQAISWSLPTTYIFEGMRALLNGSSFPTGYCIVSFALNIIYLVAAIGFFKFMFEKSRDKGLARLE